MWAEDKVRIKDIAEELGLSTATVSNVLHGKKGKVSAQTARRVQQKLEERGYIPNMAATLLAQNTSRIVGVVVKDHEKYGGRPLADPFIASAVNDLAAESARAGWFLMVKTAQKIMEAAQFASMWNMDGMFLVGFCADEYQRLRDAVRIPFVVYDGCFENAGRISNLCIDDEDGGRQVGRLLARLGHKRVLCVADNRECMDLARYKGLCAGLGFAADFCEIPPQRAARSAFWQRQLPLLRRYTAVFAASDFYAAEMMQFLQRNGVRLPQEMSVVGFDDGALCELLCPALTSVRQDSALRAATAVRLLRRMREEPGYYETLCLPVQLIERASTAPPPGV